MEEGQPPFFVLFYKVTSGEKDMTEYVGEMARVRVMAKDAIVEKFEIPLMVVGQTIGEMRSLAEHEVMCSKRFLQLVKINWVEDNGILKTKFKAHRIPCEPDVWVIEGTGGFEVEVEVLFSVRDTENGFCEYNVNPDELEVEE